MDNDTITSEPVRNRTDEVIGLWGWQFHELMTFPVLFFASQLMFHRILITLGAIGIFAIWARYVKKMVPDGIIKHWVRYEWAYLRHVVMPWLPPKGPDYLSAASRDYLWRSPVVRVRPVLSWKDLAARVPGVSYVLEAVLEEKPKSRGVLGPGQKRQPFDG